MKREEKLAELARLLNELDAWVDRGRILTGNDPSEASVIPEINDEGVFQWVVQPSRKY